MNCLSLGRSSRALQFSPVVFHLMRTKDVYRCEKMLMVVESGGEEPAFWMCFFIFCVCIVCVGGGELRGDTHASMPYVHTEPEACALLCHSPPNSLETGPLTPPGARLEPRGSSWPPTAARLYPGFTCALGIWTQVLMMSSKGVYMLSHLVFAS